MTARLLILLAIVLFGTAHANATEAAWARLADGRYVVLMLHAIAPGTGDKADFTLGDCSTQRNLSDRGRQQAFRMGARIEARAVPIERVLTSQLCRSKDTARLAFGGVPIEEFAALNPLPDDPASAEAQTAQIIERIRAFSGPGNLFLITHENTIEALTGIKPRAAEAIIVEPAENGIHVVARLIVN